MMSDTVAVAVVLGSDFELLAAEYDDEIGVPYEDYFLQFKFDEGLDTYSIGVLDLPRDLAEHVVAHGTSNQVFSDGYQGQQALVEAVPKQMGDDSRWEVYGLPFDE